MAAEIYPIIEPDSSAMAQHLEALFGGDLDGHHEGLVELAYTDTMPDAYGRRPVRHGAMFGTDEFEELVTQAVALNRQGCNVYIGAALRKAETARAARATDADFLALPAVYVDIDDNVAASMLASTTVNTLPTLCVVTGTYPGLRMQAWWRLIEPITDPARSAALLRAMAVALGGDVVVANPGRVMRLAGSVAWPVKTGRRPELTRAAVPPGSMPMLTEALERRFPPVQATATVQGHSNVHELPRMPGPLGLPGALADGREQYMRDTILAVLVEWIGTTGAAPTVDELLHAAWPQYAAHVDLTRPGRGPTEFEEKCAYTLRRFHEGKIPGLPSLEAAVAAYAARDSGPALKTAESLSFSADFPSGGPMLASDTFPLLGLAEILSLRPPQWLVDGLMPDDGITMLYAAPAAGKSFLALDIGLHIACGRPWHGRSTRKGPVVYIAGEGAGGYRHRVGAWNARHGAADGPFYLLPSTTNLMTTQDNDKLYRTIEKICPALTIVDTVARAMTGGDENSAKDTGVFISNLDRLRQATGTAILAVHHTGKDTGKGLRGNSAIAAAAHTILRLEREEGSELLHLHVEKQKDAEEAPQVVLRMPKQEFLDGLAPASSRVIEPATGGIAAAATAHLPHKDVLRQVLADVATEWAAGRAFSHSTQTRKEGRYLPLYMSKVYGIKERRGAALMQDWLTFGVLSVQICSTHSKKKGLKVTGSI